MLIFWKGLGKKMLTKVRNKIAGWIASGSVQKNGRLTLSKKTALQSHPAQKSDVHQLYAPTLDLIPMMIQYALNNWVYAAANKIARLATSAEFMILSRDGMSRIDNHPLLDLLGKFGTANDNQDTFEFFEAHFINFLIAGNVYWLWDGPKGGMPEQVFHLEPEKVRIVAGSGRTVARYEYWHQGQITPYLPSQITHFKTYNPYNRYYGLSALQVLYLTTVSDNSMLKWNFDFFDDELGLPSGIVVVPEDTTDKELERFRAEFTAQHGAGRRVAFLRAEAGKAVFLEGVLKHRDYDFEKGRTLNRKSVYEGLDLHLGIMSENSTEANAIVAERRYAETARFWHLRTIRKLNSDGLDFWPGQKNVQTEFEDVTRKAVDWRREKERMASDAMILSRDEMRMREYKLAPLPEGVEPAAVGLRGNKLQNEKQV